MHGAKFKDVSQTDAIRLRVSFLGGRSIIRSTLHFIATAWVMYNMGHWFTRVDITCQGVVWRVASSKKYVFTMNHFSFYVFISYHLYAKMHKYSILNVSRPMGSTNTKYLNGLSAIFPLDIN